MGAVTVTLNEKLAKEYAAYAEAAGISLEEAVNRAADRWMEDTGSLVYWELMKRSRSRAHGNQHKMYQAFGATMAAAAAL